MEANKYFLDENTYHVKTDEIIKQFITSKKKHLLLTGEKGIGKTTLAKVLFFDLYKELYNKKIMGSNITKKNIPYGFTTKVFYGEFIMLYDNKTNRQEVIGIYNKDKNINTLNLNNNIFDATKRKPMEIVKDGFLNLGVPILKEAINSDEKWIYIDEIGYVESKCEEIKKEILSAFDKKRVFAVLRKKSTEFLEMIKSREDVFIYDLDCNQ